MDNQHTVRTHWYKLLVGLLIALLLWFVSSFTNGNTTVAYTVYNASNCSICHGTYVSNFAFLPNSAVRRTAEIDSTGKVTKYAACWVCHREGWHGLANFYFEKGSGYFRTKDSVYASPQTLHFAHDGYYGGKNRAATASCAVRCHGTVNCTACHQQTIPHTLHGATAFPAPKYMLADGTSNTTRTVSCMLSQCHQSMPKVKTANTDGNQLCVNCHPRFGATARDDTGHAQTSIDARHVVPTVATLNFGSGPQTVTCQGCHSADLSVEHANKEKDCLVCHNPVSPIPSTVKNVVINANGDQKKRSCTQCHFNSGALVLPTEHRTYHIANKSNNLSIVGGPHANCDTCHGRQELWPTVYAMVYSSPKNYSCLDCHNVQNNLAPIHKATFEGELTGLTDLHQGCGTCHTPGTEFASKVGQIITSLKNGAQTYDCVDCHTGDTLDAGHTGIIDVKCQSCHKVALTQEHLSNPITQVNNQANPLTCGTCHQSTNVKVRLAINTRNTNCAACHDQAHSFGIAQQVPADIPLYPGFEWSVSQPAEVWANETWMPAGYEGAQLIISNRRTGVTGPQVWDYYSQNMTVNGWVYAGIEWAVTAVEPVTQTNFFTAEFTKDKRKVTVFFYGGENHSPTPVVSSGYRLELLYK